MALAVVLAVTTAGCGGGTSSHDAAAHRTEQAVKDCRAQWSEVGDTVLGMDQDTNPSALADRWTSVIATVEYYKTADSAKDCQDRVETQVKAIAALRQFSDRLHPYDMTYQLGQVQAAIDLYLHEPLPAPVRDADKKLEKPPSKAAVSAAMQTLTANAAQANAELSPGWAQTSAVDLTDVAALTKTMHDLDFLAQDSPHWVRCENALQVLVAAIRAQEGLAGSGTPSASPSSAVPAP